MSLFVAPSAAMAERGEVIGDSIGVGVSWAAKLPSLAKNSVAIYNGGVIDQLRQSPRGATVFMSLGTNDAVGGALNVKKPVETIVSTADAQGVKLVWIGPPCVFKPWDESARKLDGILREELQGTQVTYVSMRGDPNICDHSVRAGDGVHFNMTGYTSLWRRAASAAGFPVVASAEQAGAPPVRHIHKSVGRKRKHSRTHATAMISTSAAPN
jgi:hypothetical protein